MSELLTFVHLGFRHITDLTALDHILFLLALAAIYRGRDWRDVLWVVTAFTVGHSVTLALAVTGALRLPTPLIEFLIPRDDPGDGAREHPGAPAGPRAARRRLPAGVRRRLRAGARRRVRELPAEPLRRLDRRPAARLQRSASSWGSSWCWGWPAVALAGLDRALALLRTPGATPSVLPAARSGRLRHRRGRRGAKWPPAGRPW